MASPVFSTRFLKQSQGGGASFTCPAGKVAVIRSVTIVNRGTTAASAILTLVGSPNVFIIDDVVAPKAPPTTSTSVHHDIRQVLVAGEQIAAVSDPSIDMFVSGYLLSG